MPAKAIYLLEGRITGEKSAIDGYRGTPRNGMRTVQIDAAGQHYDRDISEDALDGFKRGDLVRITGPMEVRTGKGRTFERPGDVATIEHVTEGTPTTTPKPKA